MKNKYLSREEILANKFKSELIKPNPSVENLLTAAKEFETANIETIKKLSRAKESNVKKINGALKQTIKAHGNITMDLISSASKRIYGSLMLEEGMKPEMIKNNPYSLRGILIGMGISAILSWIIYIFSQITL